MKALHQKTLYTIDVSVQCAGKTGQEITRHSVYATSLRRAELVAKREALKNKSAEHYAYAFLKLLQKSAEHAKVSC